MLSDHAYILYKAGRYKRCHGLALSQSDPNPNRLADLLGSEEPVMKALDRNATLCAKALKKLWAGFIPSVKCPIAGYFHAYGVPSGLLDSGTAACLDLGGGRISPSTDLYEGGDVNWVTRANKRVSQRFLTRNLGDAPCNVQGVTFRRKNGQLQITIKGQGRDCSGGQAAFSFRDIYELNSDGLKMIDQHSVFTN